MGTIWNNADGLRVQFGTRLADEEGGFAETGTHGSVKEVAFTILGAEFTAGVYTGNANLTLPAGVTVIGNALVEVTEVFVLGGTTPVINVGVTAAEGTNRLVQLSQAQAQAVGSYSIASAGTLAANTPLAAAATINIALGGTSPTITAAGRAVVRVRYQDVNMA